MKEVIICMSIFLINFVVMCELAYRDLMEMGNKYKNKKEDTSGS